MALLVDPLAHLLACLVVMASGFPICGGGFSCIVLSWPYCLLTLFGPVNSLPFAVVVIRLFLCSYCGGLDSHLLSVAALCGVVCFRASQRLTSHPMKHRVNSAYYSLLSASPPSCGPHQDSLSAIYFFTLFFRDII